MGTTGRRLTRSDWTDAALSAVAEGGIGNVSIERLARVLGVSKGSFYWHFADRPELIDALLERWEADYTAAIIERLGDESDPAVRFRRLLEGAFVPNLGVRVDAALLADAGDPRVAAALARATQQRLRFVEQIYVDLGRGSPSDRAVLALSAYTGLAQLWRVDPSLTAERSDAYVDHAVEWLLAN